MENNLCFLIFHRCFPSNTCFLKCVKLVWVFNPIRRNIWLTSITCHKILIPEHIVYMKHLTHWGRVTHICVGKLTIIGSALVAWTAPSHYLNQCSNIVDWTLRNKLQWNLCRNSNIFIQENTFESVVCEVASILSRPQCVKPLELELSRFRSPK